MSGKETLENKPIPTNEEIIDDLTKDLESTILNKDKKTTDPDVLEKLIAENEEHSDSEDQKTESEDKGNVLNDFVDEEKQMEEEKELTDEEKEKRKLEAENLKRKGNEEFKAENFLESINIYTSALRLCPLDFTNDRSVLYSNRAASKIKLDYTQAALDDCTKALDLNPDYVRALVRRAKLYESKDKLDECLEDYKKLQTLDENNVEYKQHIYILTQRIEKRNEEMKQEMMGKLKDLGNLILKPFGLSTENFQFNQDPNSGGYSVNFVQKK